MNRQAVAPARRPAPPAARPALFTADSFGYLISGVNPAPGQIRPAGYPFLLWLAPFHSLLLVTSLQHLMGIGTAVIGYAVLRHWGLPAWAATAAATPSLFDSRQIMLESAIWPDTPYGLPARFPHVPGKSRSDRYPAHGRI